MKMTATAHKTFDPGEDNVRHARLQTFGTSSAIFCRYDASVFRHWQKGVKFQQMGQT